MMQCCHNYQMVLGFWTHCKKQMNIKKKLKNKLFKQTDNEKKYVNTRE